jgi:hypothetical protein
MIQIQFTLGRHRTAITRNTDTGQLECWHGAIVQRPPDVTNADIDSAIAVPTAMRQEITK